MLRHYIYDKPFALESGEQFQAIQLAYTTHGEINKEQDNVVWICHALTANSNPVEWWPDIAGHGKLYNPEKYFIVCVNILGSCYGSTGPLNINPATGQPYYHSFPFVTVRDIVASMELLRSHLGINKIHTVIGGSLGGMQALEWNIIRPELFEHLVLIGTNAFQSAWGIALHESQRMAIEADATWNENNVTAGMEGMKVARSIALLGYRNYNTYNKTQTDKDHRLKGFSASSYQRYQGKKLADRFNAFSYYALCDTMDSHNVGRGRGSVEQALRMVKAKTCCIGINSDILFPKEESRFLAEHIPGAHFHEINSTMGHDGFLTEHEQLTTVINNFYRDKKQITSFPKHQC